MILFIQSNSEVKYKIKRFTSSKNKDFVKALSIYASNTAPALKTNTNEICYWLDRISNRKQDRQLYVLGYYKNDEIIGFAQFMYIESKRIIIVDYMAIEESERKSGTFYALIDFIQEYLNQLGLDCDYILTEIGYLTGTNIPSRTSQTLIRLVKMVGFGLINAEYFQPQLDPDNVESRMRAQLMLYARPPLSEIRRETYLSLIKGIYFDHYIEWYVPFKTSAEIKAYSNDIEKLFHRIKSKTPAKVDITSFSNETVITSNNTYKDFKTPTMLKILGIIICMFIYVGSFVLLNILTNFGILNLLLIYATSLFIVLTILGIYNRAANKSILKVLEFLKMIFGKLK